MKIETGDIWDKYDLGHWICIPTNGMVNAGGYLIMGKGLAKQASDRFPGLRQRWGKHVANEGNYPFSDCANRLLSFPTKNNWKDPSPLNLIRQSASRLRDHLPLVHAWYVSEGLSPLPICLPKVGCDLGGLNWTTQVYPLLSTILDDNFLAIV